MATETEAIEEYIAHQQKKINELVQEVMMLETRNHIQDKELEELNNINKQYKDLKAETTLNINDFGWENILKEEMKIITKHVR